MLSCEIVLIITMYLQGVIKIPTQVIPNFSFLHKKTNYQLSTGKTTLWKFQNPVVKLRHPLTPQYLGRTSPKGKRGGYTLTMLPLPCPGTVSLTGGPPEATVYPVEKRVQVGYPVAPALQEASWDGSLLTGLPEGVCGIRPLGIR